MKPFKFTIEVTIDLQSETEVSETTQELERIIRKYTTAEKVFCGLVKQGEKVVTGTIDYKTK